MSKKEPPSSPDTGSKIERFKEGYNPPKYQEERPKPPPKSPPKKEKT